MVLTLQQLLERIRPAGAPGAPTEGERQRRRDNRADEIAEVTALLAEFEAEAAATVEAAELEAKRECDQARQTARKLTATLPDRVATASAEVSESDEYLIATTELELQTETDREVARLLDQAESRLPLLVDQAIDVIWNVTSGTTEPRS
jgi:vacuolar-type H+-ATPase subunit H